METQLANALPDQLRAVAWLHEALMRIELHGIANSTPGKAMQELRVLAQDIGARLLHHPADLVQTALDTPASWQTTALAAELMCMLAATDPTHFWAHLPPAQTRLQCFRRVLAGAQWRRALTDRVRLGLEQGRVYREEKGQFLDARVLEGLTSPASRAAAGRLAMTLALHVAWHTRHVEVALAYMESVEALRLIHAMLPSESPTVERFMDVVAETPTLDDYRLLGQFETGQLVSHLADLSPLLVRKQSVLMPADLALLQEHVSALFNAAVDTRRAPAWPGE
jgi:hypothetical protein